MARAALHSGVVAAACAALCVPGAAYAQEAFAGVYAHNVDTPLSLETGEGGANLVAGFRFTTIEALAAIGRPAPYLIASFNTQGDTSFAGAGLGWTIGKGPVYLRPAVALVVHDGPATRVDPVTRQRTELGSRVLFEPEVSLGYRVSERLAVEASWMHVSHARLFDSQQNPGIDMWGARLNFRL